MNPIVIYRNSVSGHAHRVELFCSLLKLPVRLVDLNLRAGEQKKPEYLAKNPFGQVPTIEDGDVTLGDSNAILVYLAARYDKTNSWYPRDPVAAAHVQRWLSVAAGELSAGPGTARRIKLFGAPFDHARAVTVTGQLFAVLESALAQQPFLTGAAPTIADVAIYSYTALAPEGEVSLEPYAQIRAWLARIEALPGFLPMPRAKASA